MIRTTIALLLVVTIIACVEESGQTDYGATATDPQQTATATDIASTGASTAEKTYPMYGVIVSRDQARNTVNIDNEDVPGVMAPMKMDYELRGAQVASLPPDGTKVQVTLHEQNGTYWVTDVKPAD